MTGPTLFKMNVLVCVPLATVETDMMPVVVVAVAVL